MPAPTIAPDEAYIQRLVALAQAGDDASFAELYRRHYAQVRSYLVGRLGDRFEAEDVAQEVFLTARAALGDYRERHEIPWRAWLFAIARLSALRHLARRPRVDLLDPLEASLRRDLATELAADRPLGWIEDGELLELFGRLPLAQREVLTLRYALDRSVTQTAAILGRTVTDVTTLQHRAITTLRRRLADRRPTPAAVAA